VSDDVPSPATPAPGAHDAAHGDRLTTLPWLSALYGQVKTLQADLDAREAEIARLMSENDSLQRSLRETNVRLDNARLQYREWRRERAVLLSRLGFVK
jgi:chromosome segregation ATPase